MARAGDSDQRSDEELASLTPPTRSDDWAATTGRIQEIIRTPGSHVGPYIILDQLGLGGMGVVYSAYDPKLDRKVALKVLRSEGHDESAVVARLRLVSEGRALARVSHPNVVAVYDVGTIDTEVYVSMELIEGQTLGQWRKAAKRAWPEVVDMFVGIAGGLMAVHDAGLVHRDVKPDNILVDGEGRPKVTDFGLARPEGDASDSLQRREQALIDANVPTGRVDLTQTGARLGTPAYMACEQLNGKPATPQSDQFAFCVTLWEALYGERPFAGGSWVSLVLQVTEGQIREPPTPPSGRPVPGWLRRVVERGLSPDPADRWPDLRALRDALVAGDPARTRRRWWIAVGGLTMLGGLSGASAWQQAQARAAALADCDALGQRVHGVWSDDARARLRENFGRSNIEDAMGIESSVEAVLDTFAASWAKEREAVCVARLDDAPSTTPPPILERQADCLDERLEVMDALVGSFAEGGDIIVSRARRSAEVLSDLEACSDTERLQRKPPPPDDPDARQRARDLDRALMQTLVHEHVGDYEEGLRITEGLLEQALALEHTPVIAQAHYRVAVFEEKLGNYEAAVDAWAAAFRAASLCGDDDQAADAAGALAFAEGHHLGRTDAGIRWSELDGILLERLGKTHTLDEARRLDILAVLTESKRDYDEAVALHRRSLALRESIVPPTHQSIGYGLANLAGVLQNQGKLDEAEQALLRSRAIFENAFGKDNPTTAHVLNNLASVYHEQGRYAEAQALLVQVHRIWRERLGPEHPDVGDVSRGLGDAALAQGQLDAAIQHYREALTIHAKSDASEHAKSALRLADTLVLRGAQTDAEEAERSFEEALAATDAKQERLRGQIQLGLGWLAYDRGQLETARIHFERARGLLDGGDDGAHPWLSRAKVALAAVQAPADPEASATTWRALADDDAEPDAVRAEALSWLTHTEGARPEDPQRLATLLETTSPEQAMRIRPRHPGGDLSRR